MKMIARQSRREKIKKHPKSSKRYLLINSKTVWSFPCIDKAY